MNSAAEGEGEGRVTTFVCTDCELTTHVWGLTVCPLPPLCGLCDTLRGVPNDDERGQMRRRLNRVMS